MKYADSKFGKYYLIEIRMPLLEGANAEIACKRVKHRESASTDTEDKDIFLKLYSVS